MAGLEKTEFAPAERADADVIARQAVRLGDMGGAAHLYNAVNDLVMVLNRQRQIIFANRNVLALLGAPDDSVLRGLRPGEAIGCIHARQWPGGCGTTKFCSACGAVTRC